MNKVQFKKSLVGSVALAASCCFGVVACSHTDSAYKRAAASDTEIDNAYTGRSVVVSFDFGSSQLASDEIKKLSDIIDNVGISNIDKVEVAVWSDRGVPDSRKMFSKTESELADNRIETIKQLLKNHGAPSLKAFNMADPSNWVARMLKTDDAELKAAFSKEGGTVMSREDLNIIERQGSPCKAVIVVVRK